MNDLFNDPNNQKQQLEETKTNNVDLARSEYQRKHQKQQLTPMKYEQEINKVNDEYIQKNNQELSFSSSSSENDSRSTDLNLSENLTESSTSSVENEILTQPKLSMYIAEPDRNDFTINSLNQDINYLKKRNILDSIDESINFLTLTSKLFKENELKNFKILCAADLLLFFLPNYGLGTLLSHMLSNEYYDLFNGFYPEIVKYFEEFISNEHLIEKIIRMFIYIFQYHSKFARSSIRNYYASLGYDTRFFEDDDDDKTEIEISKRIDIMAGYLRQIEKKLWENAEFSSLNFTK